MKVVVEEALRLWGLENARYKLIAARENRVYRVDLRDRSFALRLHRQGYRTDPELRSELQWMDAVSRGGLDVPHPVASVSGDHLHRIDRVQVDMLTWLAGRPAGSSNEGLFVDDRRVLLHMIGRALARLHEVSDNWLPPDDFTRPVWDRSGLLGEKPVWGRFWENPTLSRQDRNMFAAVRQKASDELMQIETGLDYGLIHADLVRENVLVDGEAVQFIDFDDGGFGFRLFDLATVLMPNLHEPDYPELRTALLDGYQEVRAIDLRPLDLFMLLRATTYVGWVIERLAEDGSSSRNTRFIHRARKLAEGFLR